MRKYHDLKERTTGRCVENRYGQVAKRKTEKYTKCSRYDKPGVRNYSSSMRDPNAGVKE